MYDAILVGTDGSESANDAVEHALDIADEHGAELHALTVVNTRRYGEPALSSNELVITELEDRAQQQLEEIERRARDREVEVVTDSHHGHPSEEIIAYAENIDADMIVLGYRGQTHPRAEIGSTAERVVRGTDRPVQLI